MTTSPGSASAQILRRDRDAGWIGGVAAGIAKRFAIDVSLVRLAFVVATAAGGFGPRRLSPRVDPDPLGPARRGQRPLPTGRAAVEVALGTGLLLIAALLTFRALGIWFSDAVAWPLILIAGAARFCGGNRSAGRTPARRTCPPARRPGAHACSPGARRSPPRPAARPPPRHAARPSPSRERASASRS